jgi:dihydrofolate reductase
MNLIVAVDEAFGIGKDGGLLTRLPDDLKRFKKMTLGKIVIMGRKTIESLPGQKLLPNRETWILSTDETYSKEGALCFTSIEAILAYVQQNNIDEQRIFVSGGASIYEGFLPYVTTAYITKIHHDFDADVRMINMDRLPDFYIYHVDARQNHGLHETTYVEYRKIVK